MSEYPEGVTVLDHIAHDMRMGTFPKRSTVQEFLDRRREPTTMVDPFAEGRRRLAQGIVDAFEGMTFDSPQDAGEWLRSAIERALAATEERTRERLR
jgi:hypothetical protein